MPYRADAEALRSRCELLEKELADLRARATELESLKRTEGDVARELAKARAIFDSLGARGKDAPLLDGVRIASPCKASWDDMTGDDRVRFCGKCAKNVYNLSAMSRADAEALLREQEGKMCARIFRRADGTVMTSDCPVGVRTKRVRRLAVLAASGGVLTAVAAAVCGMAYQGKVAQQGEMRMGDVAPEMGAPAVEPAVPTMGTATAERQPPAMLGSVAMPPPPAPVIHPEPKRH